MMLVVIDMPIMVATRVDSDLVYLIGFFLANNRSLVVCSDCNRFYDCSSGLLLRKSLVALIVVGSTHR